jgi:protein TonB
MNIVNADFDEIVFEDRVKDYGAYQMRTRANWHIIIAGLIALLLFLSVTALPKMISWISFGSEAPAEVEEEFIVEEVNLDELEMPEPPPPPEEMEAPPPPIKTIEFKVPEPTPEEELEEEETIIEQDSLIDTPDLETVTEVADAGDYDWNNVGDDPNGKGKATDDVVVEDAEPLPTEFFGGEEPKPVNMDEIKKLIGYPPMAKEAEIQGKVVVRVLVDKTGHYVKHLVLKDPHPLLTKGVTDKLPELKFTPGRQNNQPVKVWVTIPFDFKLVK